MDQDQSPVLEALAEYHARGYANFSPPGHKQGKGVDDAVHGVLGAEVFFSDVLATGGLDDRKSTKKVLERAQALMADAVGAEHAYFSTCGSSLSVKSAMMAVAAPGQTMLIGRDAHKSVIAGLILTGIRPAWVRPRWDRELHLAHPPSPEAYEDAFRNNPDAVGALVTSPSPYGTCSDLKAIAEVCHQGGIARPRSAAAHDRHLGSGNLRLSGGRLAASGARDQRRTVRPSPDSGTAHLRGR